MTQYAKHGSPHYASDTAVGCEQAGEPVFLLRAQDQTAAQVVEFWSTLQRNPEIAQEARRVAQSMREWTNKKAAD